MTASNIGPTWNEVTLGDNGRVHVTKNDGTEGPTFLSVDDFSNLVKGMDANHVNRGVAVNFLQKLEP
ncbi:MAG TPA: hypothetical protein DEA55_01890 [Rhodospirillaceae bacterium]|nr:hypothetical protein [Rhodospirillaceae bacterium]